MYDIYKRHDSCNYKADFENFLDLRFCVRHYILDSTQPILPHPLYLWCYLKTTVVLSDFRQRCHLE